MANKNDKNSLIQFLEAQAPVRNGALAQIAVEALTAIKHQEIPGSKEEDWKYTRTAKIFRNKYSTPASQTNVDLSPFFIPGLEKRKLVFIDGIFRADLSDEIRDNGLIACSVSEALNTHSALLNDTFFNQKQNDLFTNLNNAFFTDGAFIMAEKEIKEPLHILHLLSAPSMLSQVRNLYFSKPSASLTITESFVGSTGSSGFTNCVTEAFVSENSALHIVKLQNESNTTFHVSTENIRQQKNSRFSINTFTLGGELLRNSLKIVVDGTNCDTILNGLYLLSGAQHADNHTLVDHRQPHCNSSELYKGVLNGKSTGVFNGKVHVRQAAQKTNAFQSNSNILLSNDATMNSKPELEIYADDVKCSHGSTIGQMDEEALFYLRSRGLGIESAKQIMLEAFMGEVLEKIEHEGMREYIRKRVTEKNF